MAKTYYKYKDRKSAPIDYAGAAQGLSDSIQGTVDKLKGEADKAGAEAREAQLLAKQTAERQVKEAYARLDKERERARRDRKDAEARADKRDLRSTTFYDKALAGLSEVDELGMATEGQANEYWQTNVLGLIPQIKEKTLQLTRDYTNGLIDDAKFIIGKTQMLDQIRMLKITMDSSIPKINETNERIAKGEASPIEPYMRKYNQEFQDWKKRKLMISPENNTIYAVGLSSDDPIDGPPEEPKYLSLTENLTGLQNQYDAYDMNAATTAYAKLVEDITIDEGGVKITDPFQTGGGADLMASIETKFGRGVSDTEKASILLLKEEYDFIQNVWTEEQYEEWKKTASKEEIRGGIWLKHESVEGGRVNAVLQENQKKAFLDDAINEIKIKAGYSKTVDTPKDDSAAKTKQKLTLDKAAINLDRLHDIFTGTEAKKQQAFTAFSPELKKLYKGFDNIKTEGTNIVITYNKRKQTQPDGTVKNISDTEIIAIETEDFKEFAEKASKGIIGNNNMMSLFEKASAGIDNLDAKYNSEDAVFQIKLKDEGIAGQSLAPFNAVAKAIEGEQVSYTIVTNMDAKREQALDYVKSYIAKSSIKGNIESYIDPSTGSVVIKYDDLGFNEEIEILKDESKEAVIQAKLDTALRKLHQKATQGTTGSTGNQAP